MSKTYHEYLGRTDIAVILACAALLTIGWWFTLDRISFEREEAVRDAVRNNSNLAIAFEEHTIRTLRGLDRVVRLIKHESEQHGKTLDARYLTEEGSLDLSLIATAASLNDQGDTVLSMTHSEGVNVADRDYFQYHSNHLDKELRIGPPIIGRVTRRPVVHLTRRIDRPNGDFGGVAMLAVDPNYFANFYNVVDLGRDGLVLLVGLDGIERVRATGKKKTTGQDLRSSTLFKHLAAAPRGNLETRGRTDGVSRFMSYRTVKDFPLVVAVATSRDEVLAEFHARHYNYLWGASLASILVVLFGGGLVAAIRRQKLATAAAIRGEAQARATFDSAAMGITHATPNGRLLKVNPKLCSMLGYSQDELLARSYADLTPPEDVPRTRQFIERIWAGADATTTPEIEKRLVRRDGSVMWAIATVALVRDMNGNPDYLISMIQDITRRKQIEEALKQSESRLDLALDASGFAVWDFDLLTGAVQLSHHWWPVLGYGKDEVPLRIEAWEKLTHQEDLPALRSALALHFKGVVPKLDVEYRMLAKNGEWRWIRTVGRVVERDAAGRALRATGTHADITARKEQEGRIARLSRIHALLSGVNSAIVRIRDRVELLNEACRIAVQQGGFELAWAGTLNAAITEITPVAWAGIDVDDGVTARARDKVSVGPGVIGRAIRERKPVACNNIAADPDVGGIRRKAAIARGYRSNIALPLFEDAAVAVTLTLYAKDLNFFTEDEVALLAELSGDLSLALGSIAKQEKLSYLACHDALTGVANRNVLNDRLTQAIAQAHRYGYMIAVAVINLDHFNLITESLGHTAGDELLKRCADRIRTCVRESDTLARLSGEEFALVLPGHAPGAFLPGSSETDVATPQMVETLQRVLSAISDPQTVGERELNLTGSIGVTLYPQDGEQAEILLKNAAAALSRAKQLGHNNFQFYTPELNAKVVRRLTLHSALRRAVERNQFKLYYQPKINLRTGELSGCEGLLRWDKPGEGLIAPGDFIPVLEETGLIIDVGLSVMEQALSTHRQWRLRYPDTPRIAVNVSSLQLAQKDFAATVDRIVSCHTGASAGLELEITESLIMQDVEANVAKLKAIRQMGVSIAIDDFGTGYSSLSQLAKLPVDILKIDRAFISNMIESSDGLQIVTTIITLAHGLGLKVVAEGVETEEQVKFLRLLSCDQIQGYVISLPLSENDFESWWNNYRSESEVGKSAHPKELTMRPANTHATLTRPF